FKVASSSAYAFKAPPHSHSRKSKTKHVLMGFIRDTYFSLDKAAEIIISDNLTRPFKGKILLKPLQIKFHQVSQLTFQMTVNN
ncbi:MAG: hypothetical protein ACJA04_000511, partial [Cellvibrionaceae bacterium]